MKWKSIIMVMSLLCGLFIVVFSSYSEQHRHEIKYTSNAVTDITQDGINFITPEKTLEKYITGLRNGDIDSVRSCYNGAGFYLSKPIPIKEYKIIKKIIYTQEDIDNFYAKNIMPDPAFEVDDVELQVKIIYGDGESEGAIPYVDGQEEMFSFYLRNIKRQWFLIAHSAWNQD